MPVCVAVVVARIALDAPIIALRLLVSAVAIALVDTTAPTLPEGEVEFAGHAPHDATDTAASVVL